VGVSLLATTVFWIGGLQEIGARHRIDLRPMRAPTYMEWLNVQRIHQAWCVVRQMGRP